MKNSILRLGYWSAIVGMVTFLVYTFCFIAILFINPLFLWTNYESYIEAVQTTNQFFKHQAMIFMIVYGASFVIQLAALEEIVKPMKRFYVKISKLFATGFFILISINYFIQISTVRMQINAGQIKGLEQFILGNPISAVAAINMLGWTIFFGLSCLFTAFTFGGTKLEKRLKAAFLASGIIMVIAAIAYLLDLVIIVFLCMYVGLGGAVFSTTILLAKLFKGFLNQPAIDN